MICVVNRTNTIINFINTNTCITANEKPAFPWSRGGDIYSDTPPIWYLQDIKLNQVNAWTKSKITGGFVCYCYNNEPVLYDTDEETQLTMTKARANCQSEKFQLNFPTGMPCRGYVKVGEDEDGKDIFDTEKTILLFTPEQIIAWDEDFSLFLAKCKGEGWVKQAEVAAATSKEELDAIILD